MRQVRSQVVALLVYNFIISSGHFAFVTAVVLIATSQHFSAVEVATISANFFIVSNVAKAFIGPALDRLFMIWSAVAGCLICSTGLILLALMPSSFVSFFINTSIIGLGMSVNGIASKQIAASVSDRVRHREQLFSLIALAANLASAIASPLALWLLDKKMLPTMLTAIASCYALAAATIWNTAPVRILVAVRRPAQPALVVFRRLLLRRGVQHVLLLNGLCLFCYVQLTTVAPLEIVRQYNSSAKYGMLLCINALLVIVFQLVVTRIVRVLFSDALAYAITSSFICFALSFFLLTQTSNLGSLYGFIGFFTLGEMLCGPFIDAIYLEQIPESVRGTAYSVLAISSALAQALGSGGVALYDGLATRGTSEIYWWLVGVASIGFALFGFSRRHALIRRRYSGNVQDRLDRT
jgi:MFS family permease